MGLASTECVMCTIWVPGAWPSRNIVKTTFKMLHSKGVLTYSLTYREETNA